MLAVSIRVDPRRLEALLEALALVPFPINPQIHHGSETVVETVERVDLRLFAGCTTGTGCGRCRLVDARLWSLETEAVRTFLPPLAQSLQNLANDPHARDRDPR
jgi:hypothetical protein